MQDPNFPTPPPSGWRTSRIVLGIYLAVGVLIALGAKLTGVDAKSVGGAYAVLGPYGCLIDAVVGTAPEIAIAFFIVESVVFLLLLLQALNMMSGCLRTVNLAGAVAFWAITGLALELLHSRWS